MRNRLNSSTLIAFVFIFILVLPLFGQSASASSGSPDSSVMYVNIDYGSHLNIREYDDISSSVITSKLRGEEVLVSRVDGDWAFILLARGNLCGWAKKEYLSSEKPDMKEPGKYRVVGDGRVAVRKKDGGVFWKSVGSTVTVLDWESKDGVLWALVRGGRMNSEYLEVIQ